MIKKGLTKLTKLINNINNKLKYFTRLYFDRWNQNIINYKNDENISLTEINKESSIKNQDNMNKNYEIIKEENKKKYNITKKQKKFFESINSPLKERNKIYENYNNFYSYDKEIKEYNSKKFIKPKNIFATNEEEFNIIFSKNKSLDTDSGVITKYKKKKQKKKKTKKNTKKNNIINDTPLEDTKPSKEEHDDKNSKSIENLGKFSDFFFTKY